MTKGTQGRASPPPSTATDDTPLRRFSQQLAQRFPKRVVKHFVMPRNVREAREIFIIEITSDEEIQAAIFAESSMSSIERASQKLAQEAERRECIRQSIVGLGRTADGSAEGEVIYEVANANGVPLEMPGWTSKAWAALHAFFGEVNGVPTAELIEGIVGARTVGAFELPTSATRASAETGRSGARSGASTSD